jgi:hypothetical protein
MLRYARTRAWRTGFQPYMGASRSAGGWMSA